MREEKFSPGTRTMLKGGALLAFWIVLMWMTKAFFGLMGAYGAGIVFLCIGVTIAYIVAIGISWEVGSDYKTKQLEEYKSEIRALHHQVAELKKKASDNADDAALAREAARETIEAFRGNTRREAQKTSQ